jgi:hypothetical protein
MIEITFSKEEMKKIISDYLFCDISEVALDDFSEDDMKKILMGEYDPDEE